MTEQAPQWYLISGRSPVLRQVCEEVPEGTDIADLAAAMLRIMKTKKGVGLAAPQIGDARRVIAIDYATTTGIIINPVIIKTPGKITTSIGEGCLSYPGKRVDRLRWKRITVEGYNLRWGKVKINARGFLATIFQHEIDHLNGITLMQAKEADIKMRKLKK